MNRRCEGDLPLSVQARECNGQQLLCSLAQGYESLAVSRLYNVTITGKVTMFPKCYGFL